jgi:signal transduction histidine kinase
VAQFLRESQKLLAIGRIAGEIAHEINNPLEAVTNLLYLIGLDPELSEATRSYLETAQRELERVIVISKQTLNFYRETQSPQKVKLSELLDEVLVLYRRKLEMKNIAVSRRYEREDAVLVFPGEMRQIFSNLIANAMDASPAGARLSLRIRPGRQWMDSGVRGMRVTVADSGNGMTPEVLAKLGKAFFTTKGSRGTGLGLWVSKAIVKCYGGDFRLRSSTAAGRSGTTFSIFLPTNLRPHIVGPPVGERHEPGGDPARPAASEIVSIAASAEPEGRGKRTLRFGC